MCLCVHVCVCISIVCYRIVEGCRNTAYELSKMHYYHDSNKSNKNNKINISKTLFKSYCKDMNDVIGVDEMKFCYDIDSISNEHIYKMMDMNASTLRICKKINNTNSNFCNNKNSINLKYIEPYGNVPINPLTLNSVQLNTTVISTDSDTNDEHKNNLVKMKYGIIMF